MAVRWSWPSGMTIFEKVGGARWRSLKSGMKNAKRTGGFSPPNTTSDSFRVGNSLFRMRPPTVALLNLLGAVPFQTHSVTRKLEEWQRLLSGSSLLDFFWLKIWTGKLSKLCRGYNDLVRQAERDHWNENIIRLVSGKNIHGFTST